MMGRPLGEELRNCMIALLVVGSVPLNMQLVAYRVIQMNPADRNPFWYVGIVCFLGGLLLTVVEYTVIAAIIRLIFRLLNRKQM